MYRFLLFFSLFFSLSSQVFASEVTGIIQTTNSLSTGIEMNLPCNPSSVANGVVSSQTCVITCNSGYTLSGQSCISSSGGGGGGGGGYPAPTTTPTTATGSTTNSSSQSGSLSSSGTTTVSPPNFSGEVRFRDISTHWAKDFISTLVRNNIVGNNLRFRPEDPLSRAEFIKIVVNSAGWDITSASGSQIPFKDVQASDWVVPYLQVALSKGLIQRSDSFRPNSTISRAEVAKILARSLQLENTLSQGTFTDVPKSSEFIGYIEALKRAAIFEGQRSGSNLLFRPNDSITRAEIAKVVVNAFKLK